MVGQTIAGLRSRLARADAGLRQRIRASSLGERALIGGSTALLLALFLPWMSVGCLGSCNGFEFSGDVDGAHGWGLVTLAGLLVVVGLWALRCYPDRVQLPKLPPRVVRLRLVSWVLPRLRDPLVYMIAGGLEAVGVVLYWFEYHGTVATFLSVSVRPSVGWFLALIGAAATIAGASLLQRERA
jgi:energy-converting hydrogenase Eha subunit E